MDPRYAHSDQYYEPQYPGSQHDYLSQPSAYHSHPSAQQHTYPPTALQITPTMGRNSHSSPLHSPSSTHSPHEDIKNYLRSSHAPSPSPAPDIGPLDPAPPPSRNVTKDPRFLIRILMLVLAAIAAGLSATSSSSVKRATKEFEDQVNASRQDFFTSTGIVTCIYAFAEILLMLTGSRRREAPICRTWLESMVDLVLIACWYAASAILFVGNPKDIRAIACQKKDEQQGGGVDTVSGMNWASICLRARATIAIGYAMGTVCVLALGLSVLAYRRGQREAIMRKKGIQMQGWLGEMDLSHECDRHGAHQDLCTVNLRDSHPFGHFRQRSFLCQYMALASSSLTPVTKLSPHWIPVLFVIVGGDGSIRRKGRVLDSFLDARSGNISGGMRGGGSAKRHKGC
ncbi:uncharacterized protein VTP21DRAFT_8766 [Calcarisporiella thermophila]|uniref:uncharacterized protein n=1 Tax=Calcarisporiella thermophila TaxID=911321 RepID=UPI003743C36A